MTSVVELGVCSPRFCSQPDLAVFLWMPNPSADTGLSLGEDGEPNSCWAGAVTLGVLVLSHPKSEREDTAAVLLIVLFSRRH